MMKLFRFGCAALLMLGAGCAQLFVFKEKVSLAKEGVPLAEIVVATNVTPSAWMAALEIQLHLKEITGADFAIVKENATSGKYPILVGESSLTSHRSSDFAKQEWFVSVDKERTEILGLDDPRGPRQALPSLSITKEKGVEGANWPGLFNKSGTLYAGYEFLETVCGVRWVDRSEWGTLTPKDRSFAIGTSEIRGRPWTPYRGGTIEYRQDEDCTWLANEKNSKLKDYRELAYPHGEKSRKLCQLLYFYRHRAGGEYRMANHSVGFFFDRYYNQKSGQFIEPHPEYFAKGPAGSVPQQLCYTNPEVIRLMVEEVRFYFDHSVEELLNGFNRKYSGYVLGWFNSKAKRWGEDSFCIEPMDGSGGFCTCDTCRRAYEPRNGDDNSGDSTYWFRFVKAVAEEIKKSHPTKRITCLAYSGHEGLPIGYRLPDNVDVFFCFSAAAGGGYPNAAAEAQLKRMRQWHETYPQMQLGLWMYTHGIAEAAMVGKYHYFPGFWAHECERQFQVLDDLNARAGFFHCGLQSGFCAYQILEYMIDQKRNTEALLNDYFAQFGQAEPAIRAFYDLCEQRFCDPKNYPKGTSSIGPLHQWARLGTAEVMAKLGALMDEATDLAKRDEEAVQKRVAMWRIKYWDYIKAGFDDFQNNAKEPKPKFAAKRIPSCGGDAAKVNWKAIPAERTKLFKGGRKEPSLHDRELRFAHDGEYLYAEFRVFMPTKELVTQKRIYPNDDIEIVLARQPSQPFRTLFCAPDGRTEGQSFGEVNWRQGVRAEEDGKPFGWGIKYVSDTSDPNCWRVTWAFRLKDQIAAEPVSPGDTVYFNITNVLGKNWNREENYWLVQTVTSLTRVHYTDRMAEVTLEK